MTKNLIRSTITTLKPGIILYAILASAILSLPFELNNGYPIFHWVLLFSGWLVWTLSEYLAHRFWMHPTLKNEKPESPFNHLYHHKHPTEIKVTHFHRFFSLIIALLLLAISVWLNNYTTLFTGYFLGFVLYNYMHFWLHHELSAQWLPALHKSHIHHHCKFPDKCFGVSTTLWDELFETASPRDAIVSNRIRLFYFNKNHIKSTNTVKKNQLPVSHQLLN